jgi:bacterioferritin-associated ferredoxin
MYVCICNVITEKQVQEQINKGLKDHIAIFKSLKAKQGCGICADYVKEMLEKSNKKLTKK